MGRHHHNDDDRHKKRHREHDDDKGDDDDHDDRRHHKSHRKERKRHRSDDDDDDNSKEEKKRRVDRKSESRRKHKGSKKREKEDSHDEQEDEDSGSRQRRHRHSEKKSHRDHHRSRHHHDSDKKRKKSSRKYESDSDNSEDRKKKKKKSKQKDTKEKGESKKSTSKTRPDKSLLYPMGEPLGKSPETQLDPEQDYFNYHKEFWVYLFREEGTAFNDLDTKQAKAAFGRFCKLYNAGGLEEPYYTRNIPPEVLEESKTTKHSWSFKTSATERKGLEQLQQGVHRQTEYSKDGHTNNVNSQNNQDINSSAGKAHAPGMEEEPNRRYHKTPEERLEERRSNRRLKETIRTTQEELTGGSKDFRERQIEKKREESAKIHGSAKDKEEAGAGIELNDSALYGDDERASFQSAVARERRNKERREEKRKSRIDELQSKEEERQKKMLEMLGLDNLKGQKIKIAPRND